MHHHHHHHSPAPPAIQDKTRELCEAILKEPGVEQAMRSVEAFLKDEQAQGLYQEVMNRGQSLHQKQEQGFPLADSEIGEFEKHQSAMLQNPVAKNFLDARELLHELHHSVTNYVGKALELGRVPTEEDFAESGCCGGGGGGGGCGCQH